MHKGRMFFCGFLILVAAAAIYLALEWPFKAALFPLSVSIPLVILAAIQLGQLFLGKGEIVESAAVDLEFSSDVPPEVERRRVITAFSWIAGFIFCVYLIGFPLTVPLFICCYLRFESGVGAAADDRGNGNHLGDLLWAVSKARALTIRARRGASMAWPLNAAIGLTGVVRITYPCVASVKLLDQTNCVAGG